MLQRIRNNLGYKLFALGIAVILSLYIHGKQNPREKRAFHVDLKMVGCDENLVPFGVPEKVVITLGGSKKQLDSVESEDIRAYLDLRGRRAGEYILPVNYEVPPGIKEHKVNPDRVRVTLEERQKRVMKVDVELLRAVAPETSIIMPTIWPENITISGPKSLVEEAKDALVTIDLRKINLPADYTTKVKILNAAGKRIRGLTVRPSIVRVLIASERISTLKVIPVRPEIVGQPAGGCEVQGIETKPATVTVSGSPQLLQKIEKLTTEPIDLSGAESDIDSEVSLRIPPGLSVLGSGKVRVRIKIVTISSD